MNLSEEDWKLLESLKRNIQGYSGNSEEEFPAKREVDKLEKFMLEHGIKFKKKYYEDPKGKISRVAKYLMSGLSMVDKLKATFRLIKDQF